MAKIENPKTYTGRDLETIFFRPMLTGPRCCCSRNQNHVQYAGANDLAILEKSR